MIGYISLAGLIIFTPIYIANNLIYLYLVRATFGREAHDKFNLAQKQILDEIAADVVRKHETSKAD